MEGRELEEDGDGMKVADTGDRANGDIDKFEDELAMGRLKVGSWRV